ncbi:hypothetical protein TWF281_003759 [Arthrobotrys megalospora]
MYLFDPATSELWPPYIFSILVVAVSAFALWTAPKRASRPYEYETNTHTPRGSLVREFDPIRDIATIEPDDATATSGSKLRASKAAPRGAISRKTDPTHKGSGPIKKIRKSRPENLNTGQSTTNPDPKPLTIPDEFRIFFCAEGSRGRDVMKILNFSKANNDKDLFWEFRKAYTAIRSWKLWFSFTHIHDIQYVRFDRYSSKSISRGDGLCHVDKSRQSLPDIKDDNYDIPHREPPIPIIRPMCRPDIMDHYSSPDDSINTSDCIRFAMPKRLNELPNGKCEAWGLHAAEAICPAKILVWAIVVNVIPVVGFAPWWLVNHPGDLQNAMVPAAMISLAYFGTVSVHVAARMGKTYNYQ